MARRRMIKLMKVVIRLIEKSRTYLNLFSSGATLSG
jgi:hypothetical protein